MGIFDRKRPMLEVLPELRQLFVDCLQGNGDINVLSINTSDGFVIHTHRRDLMGAEDEKIAALSSTVSALCSSAANEFGDGEFQVAIVETGAGYLLFIGTTYLGTESVLTCVCKASATLGEIRFLLIRLAEQLSSLGS